MVDRYLESLVRNKNRSKYLRLIITIFFLTWKTTCVVKRSLKVNLRVFLVPMGGRKYLTNTELGQEQETQEGAELNPEVPFLLQLDLDLKIQCVSPWLYRSPVL